MVLIYKIQRGTVDLTTNELAQILTEAKSQLAIFEVLSDYAVHISYVVTSFVTVMLYLASPMEATVGLLMSLFSSVYTSINDRCIYRSIGDHRGQQKPSSLLHGASLRRQSSHL